ncbi:5-carboxymethyl-2-hydroxymuconate Delta-isomerase [Pseudoalteromonas luteoviolacea]|uniref:5-carboxymethyl-2-hydroxymuconate isomerase n=1 Tax=Pseudoalteromonas luteoviolacea S4054 TaxID=1129367 RepID=A0A0F6A9E8_9GAMM|nr:5-carboxymethyl-2-hydroxymuconate Delta-isomerase [Pseudoalteromonas luteoviolacea]AOT08693.1 5-carboxymethyl-2-hydroxymuconate isomerase [Pseudoalteromonas luteoviolacea]AOT13608.1 5-carboxymethyl-2-hydroxymuconate isomerase [Pseudoalteromonas luteoviolacea]AOT18521.1 5-carboxymethyl-2-hydroxymuconate isomerase [Pseudoalteromonas luteoviolacea]KKE82471.1 5-carboxymethyl-2-hydroxymuconate isomerase [Pseudoalteromonas luteoviolacea S4054]KZN72008.1 5-carboxymethyl-2-hydroxymuconate isomerase
MPHFVMDCSDDILKVHDEEFIIEQVFLVASATQLFDNNDIKVRLNPFKKFSVGNKREGFIHVFASIMQGRTTEQKSALSKAVVSKLVEMFPDVPNVAMNISDFDKATYCNRTML